jgi:hypothetical protein
VNEVPKPERMSIAEFRRKLKILEENQSGGQKNKETGV